MKRIIMLTLFTTMFMANAWSQAFVAPLVGYKIGDVADQDLKGFNFGFKAGVSLYDNGKVFGGVDLNYFTGDWGNNIESSTTGTDLGIMLGVGLIPLDFLEDAPEGAAIPLYFSYFPYSKLDIEGNGPNSKLEGTAWRIGTALPLPPAFSFNIEYNRHSFDDIQNFNRTKESTSSWVFSVAWPIRFEFN